MDKQLLVTGLMDDDGWDEDDLLKDGRSLIATEGAPAGLRSQVTKMMNRRRRKYRRECDLWHELIMEGYRTCMAQWRSYDATNVEGATQRMAQALGPSPVLEAMNNIIVSFGSRSTGVYLEERIVVLLDKSLDVEEEEEYIENVLRDWGLDVGDTCFLFAAVAAVKRGATFVSVQEHLTRVEVFLRIRVWLINALAQAAQNPPPSTVVEKAEDIVRSVGQGS